MKANFDRFRFISIMRCMRPAPSLPSVDPKSAAARRVGAHPMHRRQRGNIYSGIAAVTNRLDHCDVLRGNSFIELREKRDNDFPHTHETGTGGRDSKIQERCALLSTAK